MAKERFCVFCGRRPQKKNREHVLPRWLIQLTGDPKRKVFLGKDWSDPKLPERYFSLSSFAFPACTDCNNRYSQMEAEVAAIIETMLSLGPLKSSNLQVLMDWFDKVRTGLWLGKDYLNKNYRGLNPTHHIDTRIAVRDRLLGIYRDNENLDGLVFGGVESPIFHMMPSCLVLIVNPLHFFNISSVALFAKQLGLPYPGNRRLVGDRDGGFMAQIVTATDRIEPPILPFALRDGGTILLQPFVLQSDIGTGEFASLYYTSEYCKNMFESIDDGVGKLFFLRGDSIQAYPSTLSLDWVPKTAFPKLDLFRDLAIDNAVWQKELILRELSASTDSLAPEQREHIKASNEGILRVHQLLLDEFKEAVQGASYLVKRSLSV